MSERHPPPSPEDPNRQGSLDDLGARIARARNSREPKAGADKDGADLSGMGLMLRVGIEMVSAVLVGTGIGWALDGWLDTKPWLMILFFVLGSAAGLLNVYRATGRIAQAGARWNDRDHDRGDGDQGDSQDPSKPK